MCERCVTLQKTIRVHINGTFSLPFYVSCNYNTSFPWGNEKIPKIKFECLSSTKTHTSFPGCCRWHAFSISWNHKGVCYNSPEKPMNYENFIKNKQGNTHVILHLVSNYIQSFLYYVLQIIVNTWLFYKWKINIYIFF